MILGRAKEVLSRAKIVRGFDHAPCPSCGYASTTSGFDTDQKNRNQSAGKGSVAVVLKVVISVATFLGFCRPEGRFVEEAIRGCVTNAKCFGPEESCREPEESCREPEESCRELRGTFAFVGKHATYSWAVGNLSVEVSGRASVFVE